MTQDSTDTSGANADVLGTLAGATTTTATTDVTTTTTTATTDAAPASTKQSLLQELELELKAIGLAAEHRAYDLIQRIKAAL